MAIPKIFHQIWINKANPDLPESFASYRDGWLRHHPDWAYRLWNLDNLPFKSFNQDKLARCGSYAQMADILRYEILFELGGVYIDTDFECLRPIDDILIGVKNFCCSEDGQFISIGIIGSEARSPLMHRLMEGIPDRLGVEPPSLETGPIYFTRQLIGGGFNNDLTIFPREWFYPYHWNELDRADDVFDKSYGVHHWAHSWGSNDAKLSHRLRRRFLRMLHSCQRVIS